MTKAEWQKCDDPDKMLDHLFGNSGDRKLRLFACACCRSIWDILQDEKGRAAVELAERVAERIGTADELDVARQAVSRSSKANCATAASVTRVAVWAAREAADFAAKAAGRKSKARVREREVQAAFLRCIFGYSVRPIAPSVLQWNNDTVKGVAEAAYQERFNRFGRLDPGRLAVLSDALEEAGCTNADILDHLRGPGPHVRGCWALDALLGKE